MSQALVYQFLPPPVELPPMRAGETDGRFMDCTPDLGPVGDKFPSLGILSLTIARQDGQVMGVGDLQLAGSAWPNTLDSTGLIVTWGLIAPPASTDVCYELTLTANTTEQGRVFVRDWILPVLGAMG